MTTTAQIEAAWLAKARRTKFLAATHGLAMPLIYRGEMVSTAWCDVSTWKPVPANE